MSQVTCDAVRGCGTTGIVTLASGCSGGGQVACASNHPQVVGSMRTDQVWGGAAGMRRARESTRSGRGPSVPSSSQHSVAVELGAMVE
eukprot:scaffold1453_cov112-Isochrysis_galbana.AAC.23